MKSLIKSLKILFIIVLLFTSITNFYSCATKPPANNNNKGDATISNPKYYYKLGLAHLESGELSQAIYYLKKAYELDSDDINIINALGIAYARAGEGQKAKNLFLKALKLNPSKGETYTNLGVLFASEGKYDDALKHFQKAVSLDEYQNRDKAFFNIALVYRRKGNFNLFEEYLKKTITFNPYFAKAYILLGNFYLKNKRYIDAYDIYLTALNMGIDLPEIYFGVGKSHYYLNNLNKAEYYLKKALRIAKNPVLKQQIEEFLDKIRKRSSIKSKEQTNIVNEKFFMKKPANPVVKRRKEVVKNTVSKKPLQEVKLKYGSYFTNDNKEKKEVIRYGYKKKKYEVPKVKFKYYLQVGLFSNYENAFKLYTRLQALGVKSKIVKYKVGNNNYYKVIVGYFKSSSKAKEFKEKVLAPKDQYFKRAIIKYEKSN